MGIRIIVGPRFELFLALAACLGPAGGDALWLAQARRKLDPAARRRMGDLALAPAFWIATAAAPGLAALEGDSDAAIAALANQPADDFARRTRAALPATETDPALLRLIDRLGTEPAGLQHAVVDALRRFDRLAFAALWRRIVPDLEAAAGGSVAALGEARDAVVFPSRFGAHRFQLGKQLALTVPVERLAMPPPAMSQDPEAIFHALGDRTRYAIARMIAREAMTGAELARRLCVSGPTLTHHLKELRRARLAIEERRGNRILLRLDRAAIAALSTAALESLFVAEAPLPIRRSRKG